MCIKADSGRMEVTQRQGGYASTRGKIMEKKPDKNKGKQETERNEKGQFPPGTSGNPNGRPKGSVSGRKRLLQELDKICEDPELLEAFGKDLKKKAKENPVGFLLKVILPFMPKELIVETKGGLLIKTEGKLSDEQLEQIAAGDKEGEV